MRSLKIQIRVEPEVKEFWLKESGKFGMSLTQLIEEAVGYYIERRWQDQKEVLEGAFAVGKSYSDDTPLTSQPLTDEIVEGSLKALRSGIKKRKEKKEELEEEFKTYFKK